MSIDADESSSDIDDGEPCAASCEFDEGADGGQEDHIAEEVDKVLVGKEAEEGGDCVDSFGIKYCDVNQLGV